MLNSSNFLTFTNPARREGVLLSHFYQAEAEHHMVTMDLFQTAVRVKARVLVFCADHPTSTFDSYLADLIPSPRVDQVKLISIRDWLPGLASFSGDHWFDIIENENQISLKSGFQRMFVIFEMGWLGKANLKSSELVNFSLSLSALSDQFQIITLMQYRRDQIDPYMVLPSLLHQTAFIYGTRTIRNPYIVKNLHPVEPQQGKSQLEHLLSQFDGIYKNQYNLIKAYENYQVLVDSIPILLANIDSKFHHIFVNKAYANFFNVRQADLIGQPILKVFGQTNSGRLQALIERALAGETLESEITTTNNRTLKLTLMPLQESERKRAIIAICEDITNFKESERRIRLLNSGLETVNTGIVITNKAGIIEWANPAMCSMTRYKQEELIGQSTRILNSKRQPPEVYEHLWNTILSGNTWEGQLINRRKDNSLYYEEMTITPVRADGNGEITHFIAIKQDITDRKRTEDALQRSEERYRMLVENQGEGALIVNEKLEFDYVNIAAENILGVAFRDLSGKTLYDFADEDGKKYLHHQITERRKGRPSSYEITLHRPDGGVRHVLITATPRFDHLGHFIGSFAIFRDISDRKEMEDELRYYSAHDRLTNLYNRFFFEEEMKRLEKGRDFPVSIIVMDTDNLKIVNDTYGHLVGDALLKRLAAILQETFRGEDVISRIGGDEFAVILPRTKTADLENSIARLRENIEAANAVTNPEEKIQISIGGATAEMRKPLIQALEQADLLMYDEKRRKKRDARASSGTPTL
jgi:diguanylate cyclase (GGDEF)-like protein/PAS domain S-box-containing protein